MIAQPYTFSITATGPTTAWTPDALPWVVVFASGGNGTVQLERSFDNGATWQPVYVSAGGSVSQLLVWALTGGGVSEDVSPVRYGTQYRLNCTAYTSGPITGSFVQ
jgi:hypothetical protein